MVKIWYRNPWPLWRGWKNQIRSEPKFQIIDSNQIFTI